MTAEKTLHLVDHPVLAQARVVDHGQRNQVAEEQIVYRRTDPGENQQGAAHQDHKLERG